MKAIMISGVLVALGLLLLASKFVVTATMTGPAPPQKAVETTNAQSDETVQAQGLHTNDTVRQVWNSGLDALGSETITYIYWLDNSTLLFKARNGPKPASLEDAANVAKHAVWLYLWKLGESPRPVSENPEGVIFYQGARGIVCYQQSKIDPKTGRTSKIWMMGTPGNERETSFSDERRGSPVNGPPSHIEVVDCVPFVDPAMAGRIYATDSNHHHYIDRTAFPPGLPAAAGESPALMKADGSERKKLPIPPEEIGSIYFRTFQNVFWTVEDPHGFVLRGGPAVDGFQKWKTTNCLALWRIDPASGAADRMCIPFGPWSGLPIDASHGSSALITLIPTAAGLFFTSTKYTDSKDPEHVGASGLYKLENGTPRRVLAGYLDQAIPSPNGCRVAFIYGPNWSTRVYGKPGSWTVAALDVCAAAREQAK